MTLMSLTDDEQTDWGRGCCAVPLTVNKIIAIALSLSRSNKFNSRQCI